MCKWILSVGFCLAASLVLAFPTHVSTGSFDIAASGVAAWNAFSWKWSNRDVQQFSLTFTNSASGESAFTGITNVQFRLSYPEAGPFFLTIANGSVVVNAGSVTYTLPTALPTTNLPPPRKYYAEFIAYSADDTRTLAKGMVETTWSLFYNTNTAAWTPISVTFNATSAVTVVEADPIHGAWLATYATNQTKQVNTNVVFQALHTAQVSTNTDFQALFASQVNSNTSYGNRIASNETFRITTQPATNVVFRALHTAQVNTNAEFQALFAAQTATNTAFEPRIANGETAYGWGNHADAGYSSATNIYSSFYIGDRSKLNTNLSGLTQGVYTGLLTTVSYTGTTYMVIGRTYAWGYTKIGASGTSTLSIASHSLSKTSSGNHSNYFVCDFTNTDLILRLDGTTLAICNVSNVYVRQITNGVMSVAGDLNVGGEVYLGKTNSIIFPDLQTINSQGVKNWNEAFTNASTATNTLAGQVLTNASYGNRIASNELFRASQINSNAHYQDAITTNYNWINTNVFIHSNSGNWAGTWQGWGTNAFSPAGAATGTPIYGESDPVFTNWNTTNTFVKSNSGNWAGTWQNLPTNTFYPAGNPSNFVDRTVTNLIHIELTNDNAILQGATNDLNTRAAAMEVRVPTWNIAVTNAAAYTNWAATNTFLASNSGNWAGTWQGWGTNAFSPAGAATGTPIYGESDPVFTNWNTTNTFVKSNSGNWAGTWQNLPTNTFYPAGNPSNFVDRTVTNLIHIELTNHAASAVAGQLHVAASNLTLLNSTLPQATNDLNTRSAAMEARVPTWNLAATNAASATSGVAALNGATNNLNTRTATLEGQTNKWLTNAVVNNVTGTVANGVATLTISATGGSGFPLTNNSDLAGFWLTNGAFVGDGSGLTNLITGALSTNGGAMGGTIDMRTNSFTNANVVQAATGDFTTVVAGNSTQWTAGAASSAYVQKAGDTMTGTLTVPIMTATNMPFFSLTRTISITNTTYEAIQYFQQTNDNVANGFSGTTFVCPQTGYYMFHATDRYGSPVAGQRYMVTLRINGLTQDQSGEQAGAGTQAVPAITLLRYCTNGTGIQMMSGCPTAPTTNTSNHGLFMGARLW